MIRSRKQPSKASEFEGKDSDVSDSKLGKEIQSHQTLILIVAVAFGLAILGFYSRHGSSTPPIATMDYSGITPGISLIPPDEDAALEKDTDDQVYHVIFSTDCGTYQHWQSYMTFYRAMKVKQPGHVTRIASGCTPEEKTVIEDWFDNHIRHMSDRFHLMLTPHFSQVKDEAGNVIGDYKVGRKNCCGFLLLCCQYSFIYIFCFHSSVLQQTPRIEVLAGTHGPARF